MRMSRKTTRPGVELLGMRVYDLSELCELCGRISVYFCASSIIRLLYSPPLPLKISYHHDDVLYPSLTSVILSLNPRQEHWLAKWKRKGGTETRAARVVLLPYNS